MATNKYTQECKDCGEIVLPGKGILSHEWDNQADDMAWVVRHSDKSICQRVQATEASAASKSAAINNGINWLRSNGVKSDEIKDGNQVVYDGRHGYNGVGWLLTRTDNTLYLTSRNGSDGVRFDETYTYTGSGSKIEDLLWTMNLL